MNPNLAQARDNSQATRRYQRLVPLLIDVKPMTPEQRQHLADLVAALPVREPKRLTAVSA